MDWDHHDALVKANRHLPTDGDVDAGHEHLKQAFLLMSAEQRAAELRAWDGILEEQYRPTRAHAEMLTKHRELRDIHLALLNVNR